MHIIKEVDVRSIMDRSLWDFSVSKRYVSLYSSNKPGLIMYVKGQLDDSEKDINLLSFAQRSFSEKSTNKRFFQFVDLIGCKEVL